MKKNVLIIGFGSIGRRHAKILKHNSQIKNIYILTKQNCKPFTKINNLKEIISLDLDYIIISSQTSKHYNQLLFLEKAFKKKIILVEKPLFTKNKKLIIKNNKVYVGYNMRFNPFIQLIKNKVKNKKIWSVNVFCGSYLPNWRENINYKYSSSAKKKNGGGVLLDLSHELDYIQWIFGKIKINHVVNEKISNLKINTDDFFSLSGTAGTSTRLQIDLNYFTKKTTRRIIIDGENISINADLIEKNIDINENKTNQKHLEKNFHRDFSYTQQHKALLNNNFKNCCTYKEGASTMQLIEKIRKFKR